MARRPSLSGCFCITPTTRGPPNFVPAVSGACVPTAVVPNRVSGEKPYSIFLWWTISRRNTRLHVIWQSPEVTVTQAIPYGYHWCLIRVQPMPRAATQRAFRRNQTCSFPPPDSEAILDRADTYALRPCCCRPFGQLWLKL